MLRQMYSNTLLPANRALVFFPVRSALNPFRGHTTTVTQCLSQLPCTQQRIQKQLSSPAIIRRHATVAHRGLQRLRKQAPKRLAGRHSLAGALQQFCRLLKTLRERRVRKLQYPAAAQEAHAPFCDLCNSRYCCVAKPASQPHLLDLRRQGIRWALQSCEMPHPFNTGTGSVAAQPRSTCSHNKHNTVKFCSNL
jgi:hypothetical protein